MSITAIKGAGIAPAVLALAVFAGGCLDVKGTEPREVIIWEGNLQPIPASPMLLMGRMTMVADETLTLMGVGVEAAEEGIRLGWAIREGSCDAAGDLVGPSGTYPEFTLDENGEGEAQTALNRRVEDAQVYAGQVLSDAESGSQLLACANLIRRP
jgi:hypothetical protein